MGARLQLLGPPPLKRPEVRSLVDGTNVSFAPTAMSGGLDDLVSALRGCDSLIHLGYQFPADRRFWPQLASEVELNLLGIIQLLDAATEAGIGFLCFASSTSVYVPSDQPVDENGPVEGATPYAAVKLMQEACALQWGRRTGLPVAILRLATVYGPGETVPRAVPNFIRAVLEHRPPVVDGRGAEPYDLVYVADVAEAFLAATALLANGIFNIASGRGRTPRQVAETIIQLCRSDLEVAEDPAQPERRRALCEVSRAASKLGFRATTSLEEGIGVEIRWLREVGHALAQNSTQISLTGMGACQPSRGLHSR